MTALSARYRAQADPLRSERRVELALLVSVVLLVLLAFYLLLRVAMATDIEPVAPAPDSVRVATLAGAGELPVAEREAMLARPLFWAGRRPEELPEEPVAVAEAEQPGKPAPRMKGVTVRGIYGSGETGGVILSVKDRQLRVAVGEAVDGWRLERVTGDRAVFISAGVRDERELLPQVVEAPSAAAADAGGGGGAPAASGSGRERPGEGGGKAGGSKAEQEEPRLTLGGGR
ncbi:MAG: hypothetical protein ACX93N_07175 [Pseudohaliea sp.]